MPKYKKKPVVVEAIQFNVDNLDEVRDFVGDKFQKDEAGYYIQTLEGNMFVHKGDFIIKGIKGEFYPCEQNIFRETYEPVIDDPKPCPFCGKEATLKSDSRWPLDINGKPHIRYKVVCMNRKCLIFKANNAYYRSPEEAIAAWNGRK